jgi:hypothetical protein
VHVEACLTTVAADVKKASLFGALTGKRKEGYVDRIYIYIYMYIYNKRLEKRYLRT